jgi:hypothetical protein
MFRAEIRRAVVKTEKPQTGNPHKLTFWQHVFPATSIRRFAGGDGRVAVKHRQADKEFRLLPNDMLFCAQRSWDQRAEAGYMKQVENDFQIVADEIISGLRALNNEKSRLVTRLFALWCARFRQRHSPSTDHVVNGVACEYLSKDQEEILEGNWGGFFRANQTMPGRFVAGLQIQLAIDQFEAYFQGHHWGVVAAGEGEFLLPDTFGTLVAVPLTPTISLVCDSDNLEIPMPQVAKLNRRAMQSARDFYIARDFSMCPM